MIIVEKKPVPIYESVCEECKSRFQYKRVEVSFGGYIDCPVCGMSVWANLGKPVKMEVEHETD